MCAPYKLITKEAAAEHLSVSKRTIDNWISDGTLPMPTSIGRRVYWHPETFRRWQDETFGIGDDSESGKSHASSRRGRPRSQMPAPR